MKQQLKQALAHLKGPQTFCQHYATIHYLTCPDCLERHGEIYPVPPGAPPQHPGCRCQLLTFSGEELPHYRQQGARMKRKAKMELARRRFFREACERLPDSPAEAETHFRDAVSIEIYLEEIEALCREQASTLARHPETACRLRDLFMGAYRYKHDLDKYRDIPEGLRVQWRQEGLTRIKECFGAILTS